MAKFSREFEPGLATEKLSFPRKRQKVSGSGKSKPSTRGTGNPLRSGRFLLDEIEIVDEVEKKELDPTKSTK